MNIYIFKNITIICVSILLVKSIVDELDAVWVCNSVIEPVGIAVDKDVTAESELFTGEL